MFTQVTNWMTSEDILQKIAQNTLGFSEDWTYASKILVGSLMYQNWSSLPNFGNETILEAGSTFFFLQFNLIASLVHISWSMTTTTLYFTYHEPAYLSCHIILIR